MLESYFKYPGVLRRMRRGPLAGDIDGLAEELGRLGYTRVTARRYLSLMATFSRYAQRMSNACPETLDVALVERFLAQMPRSRIDPRAAVGSEACCAWDPSLRAPLSGAL
jgi:hypothetical protein